MTTVILDGENKDFFKNLISPDVWASLDRRNKLAIGAVFDDADFAQISGMAVGALVAEVGTDIELLWIYVDPSHRELGAGSEMLSSFLNAARRIASGTRVFGMYTRDEEQDDSLTRLLEKNGFETTERENAQVYMVSVGAMISSVESFRPPDMRGVVPAEKLPEIYLKKYNAAFKGSPLLAAPVKLNELLPCSTFLVREGAIAGMFLFQQGSDGRPSLVHAWAKNRNDLAGLLFGSTKLLSKHFSPDTVVELATMNSLSRSVALGLGTEISAKKVMMAIMNI